MAAELQRLEHLGAAPATGLASGCAAGDLTLTLLSGTGYPTGAGGKLFVISLDPGTPQEEHVLCSARSGVTVTVNNTGLGGRGFDNTTAASHASGTTNVEHVAAAIELDDMNRHIYTTSDNDHTQYALLSGANFTGQVTGTNFFAFTYNANLTTTPGRFVGRTSGVPSSGTYQIADFAVDTAGFVWICTVGGSPGTWVQAGGATDTAWTAVSSFTNSWANQGAPYFNAGYRLVGGKVYLRGVVKQNTAGNLGLSMFTLPAAYRPASSVVFCPALPGNSGVTPYLTIASTGTLIGSNLTVGQLSLDGIVFDTLS